MPKDLDIKHVTTFIKELFSWFLGVVLDTTKGTDIKGHLFVVPIYIGIFIILYLIIRAFTMAL
ncbi:MAG TPA: hypothetical protein VJC02_00510 [Candidatus Paceibacterota bacterium]